jgi:hypothetical protein
MDMFSGYSAASGLEKSEGAQFKFLFISLGSGHHFGNVLSAFIISGVVIVFILQVEFELKMHIQKCGGYQGAGSNKNKLHCSSRHSDLHEKDAGLNP